MITLTKAYQWLIYFGGLLKSPILLIMRLYWGTLFMFSGWGKLMDIDKFAEGLVHYGFPFEHFFANLAAYTEFFGGICLIGGLASRLVAIPLIIEMSTAYATAHVEALKSFLHDPSLFVAQPPFNFLLTALLVLAFGPGRFSIDYMLEKFLFNRAESFPKHQHKPK